MFNLLRDDLGTCGDATGLNYEVSYARGNPAGEYTVEVIARGLVNYAASELPRLLGRSTRDLARDLGPEYEREVIHRDDLVVL